jgi:hypothetical protein
MVLGTLGVIKICIISLGCGRVEYKLNQLLDKHSAKPNLKKLLKKKRW